MKKFVCIHGHFYQPPRENPWLEEVEVQDSAYPYHDWNERITAECYEPNTASRILDSENRIIDIVNNFTKISFDMGPTLLSWMEKKKPHLYRGILEADKKSRELFSGHGSAIAQAYNHIIMPLAVSRDKKTQILWGLRDFEYRFGRKPEGMWLPETAVDLETLELLADAGMAFTLLAPRQAGRTRKIGDAEWVDASGEKIDPKRSYLCRLPSGKSISLFFYDGPISRDVSFGNLLNQGDVFASRIRRTFTADSEQPELVHIATDGETYGHHHRFGEMALSYCLYDLESGGTAEVTNYGEFLERFPPRFEVEIIENSSWSCIHGIERWRKDCGCKSGSEPGWTQKWRSPLRRAMNELNLKLSKIYEERMGVFSKDPWGLRDSYIDVILDRSPESTNAFFHRQDLEDNTGEQKTEILKLLEMQRNANLMFTSCGWFFDEISGIETMQVMMYAARAMQLAKEVSGSDPEPDFKNRLHAAASNLPPYDNGDIIYEKRIKPAVLDHLRIGVHFAVSSLFERWPEDLPIPAYSFDKESYAARETGLRRISVGRGRLHSRLTAEEGQLRFFVLHLGDHNLIAGVKMSLSSQKFPDIKSSVEEAFSRGDLGTVIKLKNQYFGERNYSLYDLFKDRKRQVMSGLFESSLKEFDAAVRPWFKRHAPFIQSARGMSIPLPDFLMKTIGHILHEDLKRLFREEEPDLEAARKSIAEILKGGFDPDLEMLSLIIGRAITARMESIAHAPPENSAVKYILELFELLRELPLNLNLWKSQNLFFITARNHSPTMETRAASGDREAKRWLELFRSLGTQLQVRYD